MSEREEKEDISKPAREKVELFFRWDKIVNMNASDLASFRESDLGRSVGLNRNESQAAGLNVISGQEASKVIEKMIRTASKFRKQPLDKMPKLPDWTPQEWEMAGRQIRMISRFRGNIGPLEDDNGELTPKAGAMKLWGRDELKASSNFPDKDEVKEQVKEIYRKDREEEQKAEEKKKEKEAEKNRQANRGKKNTLSESLQDKANDFLDLLF